MIVLALFVVFAISYLSYNIGRHAGTERERFRCQFLVREAMFESRHDNREYWTADGPMRRALAAVISGAEELPKPKDKK